MLKSVFDIVCWVNGQINKHVFYFYGGKKNSSIRWGTPHNLFSLVVEISGQDLQKWRLLKAPSMAICMALGSLLKHVVAGCLSSFRGKAKVLSISLQSPVQVVGSWKRCGRHLYVWPMLKLDVCKLRTLCIFVPLWNVTKGIKNISLLESILNIATFQVPKEIFRLKHLK